MIHVICHLLLKISCTFKKKKSKNVFKKIKNKALVSNVSYTA